MEVEIVTIDFETYYDRKYTLRSMSQEDYICDPRFEVLGCAIKVDDAPAQYFHSGTLREVLWGLRLHEKVVLCHHAQFDLAILKWHYGISPLGIFCSMSMGRKLYNVGGLAKLSQLESLPPKGDAIANTIGKHAADFTAAEWARMAEYACRDAENSYKLCERFIKRLDVVDLINIDLVVRMFTEPEFELDVPVLRKHLSTVKVSMDELAARVQKCLPADADVMKVIRSPIKFAEYLTSLGVTPPTDYSEAKMKRVPCFSKTFKPFTALQEHEDPRVRDAVMLKLKGNSNLERTRTEKFIRTAGHPQLDGRAPIYLSYWGAHTGRYSGGSGANWQNLPRAGQLRRSLKAPSGCNILTVDASQIECRIAAWLCGETGLLDVFRRGEDPYCAFGSKVYGRTITKADKAERFVSKVAVLGLQYNMGPMRFMAHVGQGGQEISLEEAERVVKIYRQTHSGITNMWRKLGRGLWSAVHGNALQVHSHVGVHNHGIYITPGDIWIRYRDLERRSVPVDPDETEF